MNEKIRHLIYELLVGSIEEWDILSHQQRIDRLNHGIKLLMIGLDVGHKNSELAGVIIDIANEGDAKELIGLITDAIIERCNKELIPK